MIPNVTKGEAPSLLNTDRANELIDAVNSLLKSKGGDGIEVAADQSGALTISIRKSAQGAFRTYAPLEVIEVTDDFIRVNPGTINNNLVTPIGGINNSGSDTAFKYLCVDVSVNGSSNITSAELDLKSSAPDGFDLEENDSPGDFTVLIAIIQGTNVQTVRAENMTATVKLGFEIPKSSVNIGEYDQDRYYIWEIT